MGNEATVSTSQCVHQSAWFHGSLAHLICQCQEVRGYRDPEGLGGLESEARPHSVPQISTRRRNKAISSYPSLWSPMYAARPMAIKKVPIPVCLAYRLVVSHYHTRSSLIDQLVSPPIVTRDET